MPINITDDTQEMPVTRHQKKERYGTNTDNTNATYEITDAQTNTFDHFAFQFRAFLY